MAVKRRNQKKTQLKGKYENAVKILCCYCQDKDTCSMRERKEKSEAMGITTYCTSTPNRPKSYLKKHKNKQ